MAKLSENQKQSTESQADSEEKAKDYKAQYEAQMAEYKKLQGEHQKSVEKLQSAQGTLDTLDQYGAIDWNKISGNAQPETNESEGPKVEQQAMSEIQRLNGKMLTLQFRLDNPDLKEYEDDLVAPFVIKARHQNPRKSQDQILSIASDNVRSFLKKHEESVLAKQKEEKVKTDENNAGGLESGSRSTSEESYNEDEARQRYVDERRKRRSQLIAAAP